MKENRIEEGRFSEHGHGLGTVTEEMVRQRAREIAVIKGRRADQLLDSDLDQARRELTGQERLVPDASAEDNLPEESRWEPNQVSEGRSAPTVPASDEQTFAEKLVEEGVQDAEHEQMLEATKQSLKQDKLA